MKVYLAGCYSRPYVLTGGGNQMTIYLAGGVTGNLNAEWRRAAERERV